MNVKPEDVPGIPGFEVWDPKAVFRTSPLADLRYDDFAYCWVPDFRVGVWIDHKIIKAVAQAKGLTGLPEDVPTWYRENFAKLVSLMYLVPGPDESTLGVANVPPALREYYDTFLHIGYKLGKAISGPIASAVGEVRERWLLPVQLPILTTGQLIDITLGWFDKKVFALDPLRLV